MTIYSLSSVKPIAVDDLLRVGRNADGGYVLSHRQVERTKILLSFGVCTDWSFEADFLRRMPSAILHAYDYSVSMRVFAREMLKRITHLRLKHFYENAQCLLGFHRFFNPKKQRFFHKKFVGTCNSATSVSVEAIFKHTLAAPPQDLSVFVKMDIESAEYAVLPLFEPYFDTINGFAIEFHRMDIATPAFEEVIQLLKSRFYVAHVHANNCGDYIGDTASPEVLEITFINKRLTDGSPMPTTNRYPVPGLDFPNKCKRADLPLEFE